MRRGRMRIAGMGPDDKLKINRTELTLNLFGKSSLTDYELNFPGVKRSTLRHNLITNQLGKL